ncbi:uncharacterized protein LOC142164989 [Nicotiana tabacum]|uniref:Uncharacterized protein LOC142164989 n=1 Tax=Nicotiana tabacum TaxID=4097 RepID=A0AC58S427_TOBAC
MPLAIYKKVGLGMPRPTSMRLQMADHSIKRPVGIVDDVLVKVGTFHLPADFIILDCAVDKEIPIILGRPFLATRRALMHSKWNEIKFRVNDEEVTFQASKGIKLPHEYESTLVIDVVDEVEDAVEIKMEEQCLGEALAAILVNFDGEDMEGYMESINALEGLGSYTYAPTKLSLTLENRVTPPAKPSIIEPPQLELKPLPPHLRTIVGSLEGASPDAIWFMQRSGYISKMHDVYFFRHGRGFSRSLHGRLLVGIALGHKISKRVIEIDRTKIKVISKLPPPTSVKGVRSFLGHAGFYRRFIKDFSKIANPMFKLHEKDAKFVGVAIREMLGQRHNKVLHPVYYASKMLNGAQMNYMVTEQELLAIVYAFEKFQAYLLGSKDRKGTQNQVVDHLSRLEEAWRPKGDLEINDAFPDEHILALSSTFSPWYADIANYLVSDLILDRLETYQKKKVLRDCRQYYLGGAILVPCLC